MSLQERILANVPQSGIRSVNLYDAMKPASKEAIDTALSSLLRSQRVLRSMGVYQPGPNKTPCIQDFTDATRPNPAESGKNSTEADQQVIVVPGNIRRSVSGLREVLFDELDRLKSGETTPQHAKSVAAVAMTLLKSVEVQINYQRMVLDKQVPESLPEMPLALPGHK